MKRRNFIKTSGALAAAGMAGLAGCTGSLLGGSGGFDDAADWFIAPDFVDRDHYSVVVTSPSDLDEYSSDLDGDQWDSYENTYLEADYARLWPDEIDQVIEAGTFKVIEGDLDADRIIDYFEDEDAYGYEPSHEGFEIYTSDSGGYAIDDDVVVEVARTGDDVYRDVTDMIDTAEGELDRYQDREPHMEELIDAVSGGQYAVGWTHDPVDGDDADGNDEMFENEVGSGASIDVGSEDTDVSLVMIFRDEIDVVERDMEDYKRDSSTFDDWREVDLDIDDNVVTFEGYMRTRDVTF